MANLVVRCSELSKIMTKSRSKSNPLSETTKSYVMEKAKEAFFGIRPEISNKYTEKGLLNEDQGIEMVNQVRFMDFRKNQERKNLDWLTGECDILGDERIIDIKCSWSFETFPAFQEEAEKSVKKAGYDWQMRGYMMLYDRNVAEVVYCLTSTPPSLLSPFDIPALHDVDHIAIEDRMTSVKVERCNVLETEIYNQYKLANEYYKECMAELETKRKKSQSWI